MDKVKNRTPSVSLKDINFTPILIAVLVLFITFGKLFFKLNVRLKILIIFQFQLFYFSGRNVKHLVLIYY